MKGQVPKRINIPHTQSMSWLLETQIHLSVRREEKEKNLRPHVWRILQKKQFELKGNVIFFKCSISFEDYFLFYFLKFNIYFKMGGGGGGLRRNEESYVLFHFTV